MTDTSSTSPTPETLAAIQFIARLTLGVPAADLRAVQDELSLVHAAMPILDPTRYRDILPTMGGHEELVAAFARFHREVRRIVGDQPGELHGHE